VVEKNGKIALVDEDEAFGYKELKWLSRQEILDEVNADRSDGWTPYTIEDWEEAMLEWTDYRYATKLETLYGVSDAKFQP